MTRPTYTEKLHAYRLKKLFEREEPWRGCPAAKGFDSGKSPDDLWNYEKRDPCKVCTEFVGLKSKDRCPCFALKDPIGETHQALKQKGYF